MNKRLKKLRDQSYFEWTDPFKNEKSVFSIEKFAELIVKDCGRYLNSDEFVGRRDLDWLIVLKHHYGIK